MKNLKDYFGEISETEVTLQQMRNRLANQSLSYILIIGLPGIAISLLRAVMNGWQLVMTAQLVLYLVTLATVIFRKRITYSVRVAVLLGANLLLGIIGLESFGLAGIAILTLALFCLLTAIFLGNRSALIALIISLVVVLIAGVGAVTGNNPYTFDANVYIVSLAAWLFAMIGLTIIAGLSIIGVGTTQAHLQNALQQSQAQYKTLFDKANDVILISDMHGNLLNVNQRVCTQLGYSCKELRGMTVENILASEYVGDYHERISKIISLGHIVFDTAYLHRNGRIIPVELSATLIEYG
ncbi:MAG: PAS domain S-box protein, partial [Anaerolineales bacterium]|nr:PAS domain S-box protein [Anaerolineales bacterium]